jgi:hypothetical protein
MSRETLRSFCGSAAPWILAALGLIGLCLALCFA